MSDIGMMGNWFGWLSTLMIVLIIAALTVLILSAIGGSPRKSGDSDLDESAMEILKKRYASGQITRDEFERMKKDITEH
jgi:putative membrane protein